jgi:hypothetical protein
MRSEARPGFWKRLFGGKSVPGASAAKSAQQQRPVTSRASTVKSPVTTVSPKAPSLRESLQLPPEFDRHMSYRDMFRTLPPERLRAMCNALPVEYLDLNRPGRPGIAVEMGRAITQVFAVSIYMATKEVPAEYGDLLFPRLVAKICEYSGADLHLELCDLVRDFAIHLASVDRNREALDVLNVLRGSLFWHTFSQGDLLIYGCLHNIAQETNARSDIVAALSAAKRIPASQLDGTISHMIQNMENKLAALE